MNHFLICAVWNVAILAGGGDMDRPLQSEGADSVAVQTSPRNRVEVRYGEQGATFEFRHSWIPLVSTDLYLSTNGLRGLGLGVSLDPVPVVSIQGSVGFPVGSDRIVDGPTFSPDYTYGIRGAFLIPLDLGQARLFVSLSGGKVWIIDKNYNPNAGFFIRPTDDTVILSGTRKETRSIEFFEVGLGLRF
jgi:hypothetical protein